MKKRTLAAVVTGLVVAGAMLFSACSNVVSPSLGVGKSGEGKVIVSFSAGRMALSPSDTVFDWYKFEFKKDGTTVLSPDPLPNTGAVNGGFTFTLPTGSGYSLEAKAYKGSVGEGNLAATGTGVFNLNGPAANVTVKLTGISAEGTGTFSYSIKLNDAVIEELLLLDDSDESPDLLTEAIAENGVIGNYADVSAGWHFVILRVSKVVEGKTYEAGYANGVLIYANNTTYFGTEAEPFEFGDDEFIMVEAPKPPDGQVLYWPGDDGFFVAGNQNNNDRYNSSGAIGTRFSTYTDLNGKTWNDVLKIEPPDGNNYGPVSMAFTYPLEAGLYSLSFKVWIEGSSGQFFMQPTNWGPNVVSGNVTGGWHDMDGTFEMPSEEPDHEIGIITSNFGNANIYIRDLELVRLSDGQILLQSTPNFEYEGLELSYSSFTLVQGKTRTITANKAAAWSVEPAGVVTIEAAGDGLSAVVTAVSAGTATITAAFTGNPAETATATVTVLGEGEKRYIALSFDDGPNGEFTPRFMDILESRGAYATFFCTSAIDGNQQLARDMVAAGHEIGNHTRNHTMNLQIEPLQTVIDEIEYNQNVIFSIIGKKPALFRAPALLYHTPFLSSTSDPYPDMEAQWGGNYEEACRLLGMSLADASGHQDGNYDWDGRSPEAIFEHAKELAKDWGILLLHDSSERTEEALPLILDWLIDQGYEVLTISDLAAKRQAAAGLSPASALEPGRVYYDFVEMPAHITSVTVKNGGEEISSYNFTEIGETLNLSATIQPAGAQPVYWFSSNENVASVSSSGTVKALRSGNATIRAASGGMRALVNVSVLGTVPSDFETLTSWDAFEYPDETMYDNGRLLFVPGGAKDEVLDNFSPGDGSTYNNVLKLSPLSSDYVNNQGVCGSMTIAYAAPFDGVYTLSMDVWVEPISNVVDLEWYQCDTTWNQFIDYQNVAKGTWLHIEGTTNYIYEGTYISFLAKNYNGTLGLRGATIYVKDLVLEWNEPEKLIMDISSTASSAPEDSAITLKWAEDGALIEADAITVKKGGTVAITAPPGLPMYQWRVGRETYTGDYAAYGTFVFDSTAMPVGTYTIGFYSGTEFGGDAVKITVTY